MDFISKKASWFSLEYMFLETLTRVPIYGKYVLSPHSETEKNYIKEKSFSLISFNSSEMQYLENVIFQLRLKKAYGLASDLSKSEELSEPPYSLQILFQTFSRSATFIL